MDTRAIDTNGMHPGYLAIWAAWTVGLLATVFLNGGIWISRMLWTLFISVEIVGAYRPRPGGDTLSEFMQMIASWAGPQSRWWQSWKGFVSFLTGVIAFQAAWTAGYGGQAWDRPVLAILMGCATFSLCLWHWINPRVHG